MTSTCDQSKTKKKKKKNEHDYRKSKIVPGKKAFNEVGKHR